MKASPKVMAVAALLALAIAAPAAASSSSVASLAGYTPKAASAPKVSTPISAVKASGTVRVLDMRGSIEGFRVSYGVTKKPFLTYSDGDGKMILRALTVKVAASTAKAVRFTGVGIVNGKRVRYHAIVVQGAPSGQDRFGIAWGHGALFGGHLMSGAVHIYLPLSHVGYRPATKT